MSPLIIIADPARIGDDAVAIAILAGDRSVDIKLIIATSGNVWAEEAVRNARALLTRLRRDDVDLRIGMPWTSFRDRYRELAEYKERSARLRYVGAFSHPLASGPTNLPVPSDLFELIAAAKRSTLLVIAPSSPLVPIMQAHPELANYIDRLYLMGGTIASEGNATSTAEFNFWFDPEAAETLLASTLPITLLPLDAVRALHYSAEFAAKLSAADIITAYVRGSIEKPTPPPVCDEALAAAVIDPSLISSRPMKLAVETTPGSRYGAVKILPENSDRRPVEVIDKISEDAFWQVAGRALGRSLGAR